MILYFQSTIPFERFLMHTKLMNIISEGNIEELRSLIQGEPIECQSIISSDDFDGFFLAAVNGHLDILKELKKLIPADQVADIIRGGDYTIFYLTAEKGHSDIMVELITSLPANEVADMIRSQDYNGFCWTAGFGDFNMMERLLDLMPADEATKMISINNYRPLRLATEHGQLDMMVKLINLMPAEDIFDTICFEDYDVFCSTARNGHIAVMEKLLSLIPADEIAQMITADDYEAFNSAERNGHLAVIERLMLFPEVFWYAEESYTDRASAFAEQFFERLRQRMSNSTDFFDITDAEEARLCFYIMRHFIEQNTDESYEKLRHLLTIPALQHRAHQTMTQGFPNELLSVAREVENRAAITYLLTIPAVNALDQIVYEESSMRALTEDEVKKLRQAAKKYLPKTKQLGGAAAVIDSIKKQLITRYEENAAMFNPEDGSIISLPLSADAFNQLALSPEMHARALISYYQHPLHSAYRYLSKPNSWIHPEAEHVYREPDGTAYSTYETHQELIALMYLAVTDEDIPVIHDISTEVRLNFFFNELAWIGRAHNWNETRINAVTDEEEYYDDLEADKPSCAGGIKRRLMQASFLLGHPLFEMLNSSDIDVEVIKIVRAHFMSRITDANIVELHQAWDDILAGDASSSPSPLDVLNFSAAEQEQHISTITEMFEHRLDGTLKYYLQQRFDMHPSFKNLAEQFGSVLTETFEQKMSSRQSLNHRFFNAQASDDSVSESSFKRSRRE